MKKKIFITADEHGDYNAIKEAEKEAGYDETNPNHFRISLGDCFDRQTDSLAIYKYYKRLCDEGKMVIVNSNHFPFLTDYLDGTSITPYNYIRNGVNETLADFLHETRPFETWCLFNNISEPTYGDFAKWIGIARSEINEEYPELLPWLKSLPYFYETKSYIFTHGGIDGMCEDWKRPPEGWERWTWAKPEDFFNPIMNTDKKVVVGHINCGLIRSLIGKDENDNSTFEREDKRVICLDACTIVSHKVNMLVIEDEIL